MSNNKKQNDMNFPTDQHILSNVYGDQVNNEVKKVLQAIKDQLKGARLIVEGVDSAGDFETLKDFGAEIIKRDEIKLGMAVFYAGFEKPYYLEQMSAAQLVEKCQNENNDLKVIHVRYVTQ